VGTQIQKDRTQEVPVEVAQKKTEKDETPAQAQNV